jgi:gamma-tubulin complex component 2
MQESSQAAQEAAAVLASVKHSASKKSQQQAMSDIYPRRLLEDDTDADTTNLRAESPFETALSTSRYKVDPISSSSSLRRQDNKAVASSISSSSVNNVMSRAKANNNNTTTTKEQPLSTRSKPPLVASSVSFSADTSVSHGYNGTTSNGATTTTRPSAPNDDDENDNNSITAEELEPIVGGEDAVLDALCLYSKQTIMIRTHIRAATLQVTEKETMDDDNNDEETDATTTTTTTLEACGKGLNLANERWILYVVGTADNNSPMLRFGDTICLLSTLHQQFLGLQQQQQQQPDSIRFQVGCFRSQPGKAEQWIVLRADTINGAPIQVGSSAVVDHDNKRRLTAPIRAGDGIVLRNCQTGGIVSVDIKGNIHLLTDSYDSSQIRHGKPEESSLLTRLQQHARLVPSITETLFFIASSEPPLPLWLLRSVRDKRIYQEGCHEYLLDQQRHNISESSKTRAFNEQLAVAHRKELAQLRTQDQLLVHELLGAFVGLEGRYIRVNIHSDEQTDRIAFHFPLSAEVAFDIGSRNIVEQLLPLANAYVRVQRFIASHRNYVFGTVMHALCEAMDSKVQDYLSYVGSLERNYRQNPSQHALLRQLQVDILPSMNAMICMYQITQVVRNKTGGALLNSLQRVRVGAFHGSSLAEHIVDVLLDQAAIPYLQMLGSWVESGVLDDPYSEFMIRQDDDAVVWEKKFSIASSHVLDKFFQTKTSIDKVLHTGRYWSVVHGELPVEESFEPQALSYSSDPTTVSAYIYIMHGKASSLLVQRLLGDHNLLSSLRLMKRYFLLDQGDFFVNFMDAAEVELLLGVGNLSRGRVEHWFSTSVQLTEHGEAGLVEHSPRKDGRNHLSPSAFRCRFVSESLVDALDKLHGATEVQSRRETLTPANSVHGSTKTAGLTGMDTFVIDMPEVAFPVSVVLNSTSMSQYQLLFRHLFLAKYVERRLVGIWQDHQAMKELQSKVLRGLMGPTFLLRQRMLYFMQNLIYYLVIEVVDPNWTEMETAIVAPSTRTEQTIDDILGAHQKFLDTTLEACLMTNRNLLLTLTKVLNTCLMFGDQMRRFMRATNIEEDQKALASAKRHAVRRTLNDRGATRGDRSQTAKNISRGQQEERSKRLLQQTNRMKLELNSDSYRKMIDRFDIAFTQNSSEFVTELKHAYDENHIPRAVNLVVRLDNSAGARFTNVAGT